MMAEQAQSWLGDCWESSHVTAPVVAVLYRSVSSRGLWKPVLCLALQPHSIYNQRTEVASPLHTTLWPAFDSRSLLQEATLPEACAAVDE